MINKFKTKILYLSLMFGTSSLSALCFAEKRQAKPTTAAKKSSGVSSNVSGAPDSQNNPKIDPKSSADGYIATSSTKIDFTETSIDGQMKSPDGFMLQGQQGNSMSQMVKLRSNFRNELNNSKSATKALVK